MENSHFLAQWGVWWFRMNRKMLLLNTLYHAKPKSEFHAYLSVFQVKSPLGSRMIFCVLR